MRGAGVGKNAQPGSLQSEAVGRQWSGLGENKCVPFSLIDLHIEGLLQLAQVVEIALKVTLAREYHLPVVPALDDVVRVARQDGLTHPGQRLALRVR